MCVPAFVTATAIGSAFHCPAPVAEYATVTGVVKSVGAVTAIVCPSPSYVACVENVAGSIAPNVTFAAVFSSSVNSIAPGLSWPGSLKLPESITQPTQSFRYV